MGFIFSLLMKIRGLYSPDFVDTGFSFSLIFSALFCFLVNFLIMANLLKEIYSLP